VNGLHADLLVIGFGKGGNTLAAALGRRGRRVVMVEQSDQMYGGTFINIGCVPTKALIHRASARPQDADVSSWYADSVAWTASLTSTLRYNNFRMLDALDSVTVVTGTAAFLDEKRVEVTAGSDRMEITADTIVINTGAQTVVPDIPGLRDSGESEGLAVEGAEVASWRRRRCSCAHGARGQRGAAEHPPAQRVLSRLAQWTDAGGLTLHRRTVIC
jgi:pyruvate/2-oxoglutarate dehydrogenase complex dihydrolipoamide dehydrogenase (E3) component